MGVGNAVVSADSVALVSLWEVPTVNNPAIKEYLMLI
jgi:hypothetical protein